MNIDQKDAPLEALYGSYVAIGVGATLVMLVAIPLASSLGPLQVNWPVIWGAVVAAAVSVVVISVLPWRKLLRSPWGRIALYAWSLLDLGLIGAVVAATGGADSWFWVVFMLITTFFSAGYAWKGQFGLLAATLVCYTTAIAAAGSPILSTDLFWKISVIVAQFGLVSYPSGQLRKEAVEHERARREADLLAIRLEEREAWWRSLIEHTSDPIVVFDDRRLIVFANPAFQNVLGHSPRQAMGLDLLHLVHPDDLDGVKPAIEAVLHSAKPAGAACRVLRKDGDWRHVEVSFSAIPVGGQGHVVANLHDVTSRVNAEANLTHQATHDPLTDLSNRRAFYRSLDTCLAMARATSRPLTVLMADLDGFKEVNDLFGHDVGDMLLVEVGRRFEMTLREADMIARLGGDEFGAVLATGTDLASSKRAADRLLEALTRPFLVSGRQLELKFSIGLAGWPLHGDRADELVRRADEAMYRAKRAGGGVAMYKEDRLGKTSLASSSIACEVSSKSAKSAGRKSSGSKPAGKKSVVCEAPVEKSINNSAA